jgi:general secretion pathway protein I
LFPAAPPPIDGRDRDAGFTIIEVLIALAVVAVSIVAIGSVMSTNARGVRLLEQHVTLMQNARTVMTAGIPPRAELGPGELSGVIDDYKWNIDVGPLGEGWDAPGAELPWIPALVRIRVKSPSGAESDLRTVRLMRRQPQ